MLDASGLPRVYWILWVGALINRLGGFVMPLLALYLTGQRGLSVEQAGLVVSLLGAGALLSGPVGGYFADRVGRRRTLVAALALGALAMLHLAIARAPLHIGAAAFLLGLLGEMYRPAVAAAIADVVPSANRARAYGILYWAVNIGFAVAVAADAAPPAQRGAYQGLFHMSFGVASLSAPLLGSMILGRFGQSALWTCCLAVGLASACGQLALGTLRRHGENLPARAA